MNRLVFNIVKIAVLSFIFTLGFAGCDPQELEEDYSISVITIFNIPAKLPVFENESAENDSFKVYLNASDFMEDDKPPSAKGVAALSGATLQTNGTHTVTIHLQNPNPPETEDPNAATGPWSGTANFFSVMLSPQNVTAHGVNAVWIKGSATPLNKGKANTDWNSLMDFRAGMKVPDDPMEFAQKTTSLFTDIVLKDTDITRP